MKTKDNGDKDASRPKSVSQRGFTANTRSTYLPGVPATLRVPGGAEVDQQRCRWPPNTGGQPRPPERVLAVNRAETRVIWETSFDFAE